MKTLIADSGSTKTSWCLVDSSAGQPTILHTFQTQGLNPLYASEQEIKDAARSVVENSGEHYPDRVQFYGAGCSGERIGLVRQALQSLFTPATRVEVASDLVGACRALYPKGGDPGSGITCILGTGAIAARYDATQDEVKAAPSLGYILGDEGSGSWLGRNVLSDYLKRQMPQRVRLLFEEDFGTITAESAIAHIYQQPFPNRYLASFALFVGRHMGDSYCQKLAYGGIDLFFRRNVLPLSPSAGETVSFVGSVAFHLQDTLRLVAAMHDLTLGRVLQSPMEGLVFAPNK